MSQINSATGPVHQCTHACSLEDHVIWQHIHTCSWKSQQTMQQTTHDINNPNLTRNKSILQSKPTLDKTCCTHTTLKNRVRKQCILNCYKSRSCIQGLHHAYNMNLPINLAIYLWEHHAVQNQTKVELRQMETHE